MTISNSLSFGLAKLKKSLTPQLSTRHFSVRHFILEFICCHFILESSSMKHILFDYKVYLLEFICFNITVICCHFKQLSISSSTTAARQQLSLSAARQQLCSPARQQLVPMREGVRACRNMRAAPRDGKCRLLANMFSKLLEMIFLLI